MSQVMRYIAPMNYTGSANKNFIRESANKKLYGKCQQNFFW